MALQHPICNQVSAAATQRLRPSFLAQNCSEAAGDGIVTGESQRGRGDAADVIVSLHQLLDFCGRKFGLLHGVWLGALWRARREV